MAIDKNIDYVIQDGYENYTKNSKSVTVPKKFKSRADATPTKLAYITEAEAKQLKKQNKGTPHKGPSGVPSYDDYDARTGSYRSGAAMSAAETGGKTERDRADMRQAGISPAEAQALRSAAINAGAGQRVNPGFFDSRTHLTPAEIKAAKKARRDPNNLFGAKSYRNTGQSGIMNMIKSGGIFGNLLRGLGQKFGLGKRPGEATYDMSEFNDYGLGGSQNPNYYNDLDNELMLSTQKTPNSNVPIGTPNTRAYGPWTQGDIEVTGVGDQEILNELAAEESSQAWDNFVPPTGTHYPGSYDENDYYTGTLSFEDQRAKNKAKLESLGFTEAVDKVPMPDFMWSSPQFTEGLDNTMYGGDRMLFGSDKNQKYYDGDVLPGGMVIESDADGITNYDFDNDNVPSDQKIFNERFVDASTGSPYTSSQDALLKKHGYDPYGVGTWKNQEGLKLIDSLTNWNTRAANGGLIGYANGGLASLFTRRR